MRISDEIDSKLYTPTMARLNVFGPFDKMKSPKNSSNEVSIRDCLSLFPKQDKLKIIYVTLIQIFLGVLDLVGVAIVGILSALAINGLQSRPAGERVTKILDFIHLNGESLQFQATLLGISAALILVFKTLISIFFTRRTLFFLGRRSALLGSRLLSELFKRDILVLQMRSDQEMLYAITTGMNAATVGVVGTLVLLISDASLVFILSLGLFILDPKIAFLSSGLFAGIAFGLYYLLKSRATRLGSIQSSISVKSNEDVLQAILSYRELLVQNKRESAVEEIARNRVKLSDTSAEMSFLPNISKYVLEVSIVIGAISVSAVQFISTDSVHAISVLSVFLASSSRLAPAILRIQQGSTSIRSNLSNASRTMFLVRKLGLPERKIIESTNLNFNYSGFIPSVFIRNLSFSYPNQNKITIENVSLEISAGSMVAIVGPSGGGKSTLVDLMLGVLTPDSGVVKISGKDPLSAIARWPGAISYVPQQVNLINGSILDNVVYGNFRNEVSVGRVWDALHIAQLKDFVEQNIEGLEAQVGDRGARLSGGQRQRVGLARALYSNPSLVVLDEATSALDGETEANFSDALNSIRGECTIILIAHRLATVTNADKVVYMEEGRIRAVGTFTEIKNAIPNFASQASLLGL